MKTVIITLTTIGIDTGPNFDLYSDSDSYQNVLPGQSNIPGQALLNGYTCNVVPDNATIIRVCSHNNPVCTNCINISIQGLTTTTTTLPTTSTTTTTLPTTSTTTTTNTTTIAPLSLTFNIDDPEGEFGATCIDCINFSGFIMVNGIAAAAWTDTTSFPYSPSVTVYPGQIVTINTSAYNAVGSGCATIIPTLEILINGVRQAYDEGIGTLQYQTSTLVNGDVVSILLDCIEGT